MPARRRPSTIGRSLIFVVLIDLLLLVLMGVVCWLGGWQTALDYANALTYAGIATIAIGAMQYLGSYTRAADPIAGYHTTDLDERLGEERRAFGEREIAFTRMIRLGVAGLLLIALGQLLVLLVG